MVYDGPEVAPTAHAMGSTLNAVAQFESSDSSAIYSVVITVLRRISLGLTIVFVTPILPLSIPAITRLAIRPVNDFEKPNETIEKANPNKPIIRMVFLPTRSESRPHCRTQQPNRAKVRVYTGAPGVLDRRRWLALGEEE